MNDIESPPSTVLSDSDRELLRDSVRGFLGKNVVLPQGDDHHIAPADIAAQWRGLAELGIASLGADPAEGGLREIAAAFEEAGRASCPAPLLGAVSANLALTAYADRDAGVARLLADLGRGAARIAIAFGAVDGDSAAGDVTVMRGSSPALNGHVAFVEGAVGATHMLVCTRSPLGVAVVDAGGAGVRIVATPGLAVPPLAEATFLSAPCTFVPMTDAALESLVMHGRIACAARAVGAVARAFDLAVENAKVRKQFGMFIGQFQALQHKLADGLIALDGARLTLEHAADKCDRGHSEWKVFASAAIAFCGPALRALAVQVHRAMGAIGYSEEHEAPRHFRRVHADLVRFGGTAAAREELARFLLGPAGQ